uniref:RNA methyltransferase n=1 Tax=Dermatophagoides pteronyssinus TaxID=6956 RepID=A0A6P6Y641_DERPT|nr:7SK snRNA methylphosphate capping enzyme-like [Dermatophagoides pteronyssinus]
MSNQRCNNSNHNNDSNQATNYHRPSINHICTNIRNNNDHHGSRKRRFGFNSSSSSMEYHQSSSCLQHGKKRRKANNNIDSFVPASHLLLGGVNFNDPLNLKSIKTNDDDRNDNDDGENDDNDNGDGDGQGTTISSNSINIERSSPSDQSRSKEMINVLIPTNLQDPLNLTHGSDQLKESNDSNNRITNDNKSGKSYFVHHHQHHYHNHRFKRQRTSSESEIHRQMSLPSMSTTTTNASTTNSMIKDDSCLNHHCYHNIQSLSTTETSMVHPSSSSSSSATATSMSSTSKSIRPPSTLQRSMSLSCSSKNCCTKNQICDKQNFQNHRSKSLNQNQNQHSKQQKERFQYGNYNRYYGYRSMNNDDNKDPRLDLFRLEWFSGKDVLDIGCNIGQITMKIAKEFQPRKIIGIDIDQSLIQIARKNLRQIVTKNMINMEKFPLSLPILYGQLDSLFDVDVADNNDGGDDKNCKEYPNNINFVHINYVPSMDDQLKYQKSQYDCILCLSVTKWIHLNWGDAGLRRTFRRIFLQLRPGGSLILEPQPWSSYKKSKMTPKLMENFRSIRFKPEHFHEYLLKDVGFKSCELLGTPLHNQKGFQRPIYLYTKKNLT